MSELDLDAIKTYTDAATGPRLLVGHKWWAGENAVLTEEGHPVAVFSHGDVAEADSVFFARARADMPKLIAEVERLRAKVARRHEELRDKRTDLLNIRGILKPAPGVGDPVVPMPLGHEVAPAVEWLAAEVERLRERWESSRRHANQLLDRAERAEFTIERAKAVCGTFPDGSIDDIHAALNGGDPR